MPESNSGLLHHFVVVQSTPLNVNMGKANSSPISNTSVGHKDKEKGSEPENSSFGFGCIVLKW